MSDSNSTAPVPSGKPAKPYPNFPLFPYATKRWAKKIRGQLHYFGSWEDAWKAALNNYLKQKDALHAGRKPHFDAEGATIKEMANKFLNTKKGSVDSGELAYRTWEDYKAACALLIQHFGRGRLIDDLEPEGLAELRKKLARKWGPTTVRKAIQRIRVVFKFAVDNGLTDRLIRYGQGFKRPSQKTLRLERAHKGPKLFTPKEIRQVLEAASIPMILLGSIAHGQCRF